MSWFKNRRKFFELDSESGSVDMAMLQFMHPAIVYIIAFTNLWCYQNGLKANWTSLMRTSEQDRELNAKSTTHRFRAADLSINEWPIEKQKEFENVINYKFRTLGALVELDGEFIHRPIVIHDNGNGKHAHLQVAR